MITASLEGAWDVVLESRCFLLQFWHIDLIDDSGYFFFDAAYPLFFTKLVA